MLSRMNSIFSHRLEVRFSDCDPMGHANNAVFATYFEQARFAYCREALGYRRPEQFDFIIARLECNCRSQARMGEELDIALGVTHVGRSSFTFSYEIRGVQDGRLVADGATVQVTFDYSAQKSIPISDDFRAQVERFEGRVFEQTAVPPA
jgi:acyl-CoA thioester hydrolase